jgi:membrane-anchored protein YejM (alkaline phosphatase superfamily)
VVFGRSPRGPLGKDDLVILRQTAFNLWLINVAAGMLITGSQLQFMPEGGGPKLWIYAILALISTVALLSVPPGIVAMLTVRPLARIGFLRLGHGMMWTMFLVLLFVDKSIYNLFRYHFSSQVWDLFYTRGSEDAVHLGWQVWSAILTGWILASGIQVLIWNKLLLRARRDPETLPHLFLRPGILWCAVIVSAFFLEKMIYAQADIDRDKDVTELAKLFPLYPRLPVSEWAHEMLGVEVTERAERLEFASRKLAYPVQMPDIDPNGPRPNILILAIDCWRADMLNEVNTPGLTAYAEESRIFSDHISTGNATRFGVFGMLYGLYGPYWFPVLRERRSPVLVDTLLDLDYDIEIFSSASANYPELRSTAWARFPERVHDEHDAEEPWRRDELAAEELENWWQRRAEAGDERPFFSFILLDAPHQKYSHPPGEAPFQPSAPDLNYLFMSASGEGPSPEDRVAIKNRYLNAVLHADHVASGLLAKLEEMELAENTIVVITGDHGEEFWETGLFGHTSSFSPPQVRVPLIMRGPGIPPGVETTPTSHLDLPSTLLELLGADPTQRGLWCLGDNLLESHSPNRQRVISGWDKLALWVPDGILEVPLAGDFTSFDIQLYTYDWVHVFGDEEAIQRYTRALRRLAEGCNRFRAEAPATSTSPLR